MIFRTMSWSEWRKQGDMNMKEYRAKQAWRVYRMTYGYPIYATGRALIIALAVMSWIIPVGVSILVVFPFITGGLFT